MLLEYCMTPPCIIFDVFDLRNGVVVIFSPFFSFGIEWVDSLPSHLSQGNNHEYKHEEQNLWDERVVPQTKHPCFQWNHLGFEIQGRYI